MTVAHNRDRTPFRGEKSPTPFPGGTPLAGEEIPHTLPWRSPRGGKESPTPFPGGRPYRICPPVYGGTDRSESEVEGGAARGAARLTHLVI
jgi:hypothetical protein